MEKAKTKSYRVLASALLAVAMAFAFAAALPMQAQAASVTDIAVGDFVDVGKADVAGYAGTPHWRVLDKADDGSLLLMSDGLWTGNGTDASAKVAFSSTGAYDKGDWHFRGTPAETWCNSFEQAILGDVEGLTVKPTIKNDPEFEYMQTLYAEANNKSYTSKKIDGMLYDNGAFFLSLEELATYFPNPGERVAKVPGGADAVQWLLRSTEKSQGYAMEVKSDGEVTSVTARTGRAVRPVFWASFAEGTPFTSTEADGTKTWTIGEDPDQPEPIESAGISVVESTNKCVGYAVAEVPWSFSQYQTDKVPPIYVATLQPNVAFYTLRENGFTVAGAHSVVYPFAYGGGATFADNEGSLENSCTSGGGGASCNLGLGDVDDYEAVGIANLVEAWSMSGLGANQIPDATDLFNALKPYAKDPSNPEATSADIYWVRGAGTPERVAQGVSDYIVVALYDEDAAQIDGHVWGEEPTWEWTGDDETGYTAAKVIFTCENNAAHTKKFDATVASKELGGKTVYTAAATIDDEEYTDTKTVVTGPVVLSLASVALDKTEFESAGGTLTVTVSGENLELANAADFKLFKGGEDSGIAAAYEPAADGATATVTFVLPANEDDADAAYTLRVINEATGAFYTAAELSGAETAVTVKAPVAAPVEETITIGEGTGTTPQAPIFTGYKYSASQQLYMANEINRGGSITSVAFNVASAAPSYSIDELKIYMGTTAQSTIGVSGCFSDADLALVYSGVPSPALGKTTGWQTIQLATPFEYSTAAGNLVLAVTAKTNGESGLEFYRTMVGSDVTINRGSDGDPNVADLSVPDSELKVNDTYTVRWLRADIQLGFGEGGQVQPSKPANIVIERVDGADENQPAAGGAFVWDAMHGDFTTSLDGLVEASDFKLQTKKQADSEWADSDAGEIAIAAGEDGLVTITATIPDNTDTYDKQWRVVYKESDPSMQVPTCGSNHYTQLAAEAPVVADKTALATAIAAAKAAEEGVKVSADGSDVDPADKYVTEAEKKALDDAIAAAEAVAANADATQADVDAAAGEIAAAQATYEAAKKPGTKKDDPVVKPVDKSALATAIEAAAAKAGESAKYASDAVKKALGAAVAAAKAVVNDDKATQADIDAAVKALNDAKDAFEKATTAAKEAAEKAAAEKARANQKGKDGTALGEGASAEAAERAIMSASSDEGPAGSVFGKLKLRSAKQAKNSFTLKWAKVKNAKKYVVYAGKCGTKGMKKVGELTKTTLTVKKALGKKLAKGKNYKAIVVALDKNNNVLTTSKVAHVTTKGGKTVNASKVTTKAKKSKVALKVGKSFSLKAKAVASVAGKKLGKCRKLAYETSNAKIASVSKKGVIKAKKAGTCTVYAYAHNGVFAKIKVTVKASSLKTAASLTLTA